MHRSRVIFVAVLAVASATASTGAQAASKFADPAFQAQWQAGEAVTPNFWGPLETAKEGQQEPYTEASGGQRLVQYFDKGRMELTNGAVTNGLLATEIVTGRIQTGDNSFQNQAPPNISIAGDADNPAPTYAGLAGKGASLLRAATNKPGAPVNTMIGPDGGVGTTDAASDPGMQMGAYDGPTQHNVAAAFADYRARAGLPTIGYAISEPFRATVKVGGASKDVMVQVFERRALTYTPSNPDGFKVEYGNIGRAYYAWRYPSGTAPVPAGTTAPAPAAGAPAPATPSAPAPASGDIDIIAIADPSTPKPDTPVNLTIKLLKGGATLANTAVHVDWQFEMGVPAQTSDVTTNKDGVAQASIVTTGAIPGTNAQIVLTINGKSYGSVAGLAII